MASRRTENGRSMTASALGRQVGASGEQIRRILTREPVGSQQLNRRLCQALGLREDEMWLLAQRAKAWRRFGQDVLLQTVVDSRLEALWPRLTDDDRAKIVHAAEALAWLKEVVARRAG